MIPRDIDKGLHVGNLSQVVEREMERVGKERQHGLAMKTEMWRGWRCT